MNVGASAPEESGLYFSWGNSPGHAEGSGYDFSQQVYNESPGAAIEADLTLDEDMARQSIGTPWRMPTIAEYKELYDNCTCVYTTQNGVLGWLFTSNLNGNSIFFPATGTWRGTTIYSQDTDGYYWTSSYNSDEDAYYMGFDSSNIDTDDFDYRGNGFPVRAVQ